jgi:hypothetical protein
MQFKLLLASALASSAAADFVIYTIPIPNLDLGNVRPPSHPLSASPRTTNTPQQIQSGIASFSNAIISRVGQLTQSPPASELSAAVSANSALQKFVATASVSVPAQVTELGKYERFTETPAWYSALPSDLRAYYEGNNAKVQSVINEAAGRASNNAGPSQTGTAAGAKDTGAASAEKVKAYMGVGAAAVFGVFAF